MMKKIIFSHLAEEFAAREAVRFAQADEQVRLADNNSEMMVSLQNEVTEEQVKTTENTPHYQGYSGSLIHPAFQQPTTKREKPSTPLPKFRVIVKTSSSGTKYYARRSFGNISTY